MHQKKIPTFLDICWAVIIWKILGWNKDYDELMGEKEFLEKLRKKSERLSIEEIEEHLLKFLNKWGCRITKEKYDIVAQKLKKFFNEYKDEFFFREEDDILTFDFGKYKEKLAKIIEKLNAIDEIGPTAISKILHIKSTPICDVGYENCKRIRF